MKAIKIATVEDLAGIAAYEAVADRLLFDAKPPKGVASLPGGNGLVFDWAHPVRPEMVEALDAGRRLTEANVADAIARTGATTWTWPPASRTARATRRPSGWRDSCRRPRCRGIAGCRRRR